MNEKIVEALAVIAEAWRASKSPEEIYRNLNKKINIDAGSINAAFSIFFEKKLYENSYDEAKQSRGLRIFSDEEKEIIGLENYNYLLKLLNLGIIGEQELELILERIMELPDEIFEREDINWMVLYALTEYSASVLPGSRLNLFSSDKIN